MAAEPYVAEFVYTLDEASTDGTQDILHYLKEKYLHERLVIIETPTFHPSDMRAYNNAFNVAIDASKGDVCWFLHPDMILTEGGALEGEALAWWIDVTSYAKDLDTVVTKGRCNQWKNIHAKKFGLHYFGGYGSENEDFYHSAITGTTHKHYGTDFSEYPFQVLKSAFKINHYCETKDYERRFEKMKLCLKTQNPKMSDEMIAELAAKHPRVTLESSNEQFGRFAFGPRTDPVPDVFLKHKEEFMQFKKEEALSHG